MSTFHFIIYGRSYCHLCEDMRLALLALLALRPEIVFTLHLVDVDVDEDASLLARYDELVPVLLGAEGDAPLQQLCNYFLDEATVRQWLGIGS
jgi:hypothetical protein